MKRETEIERERESEENNNKSKLFVHKSEINFPCACVKKRFRQILKYTKLYSSVFTFMLMLMFVYHSYKVN